MRSHDSPSLFGIVSLARGNRKNPTRSEALLWARVCGKQLGVRVRRQHPLHPYIVDFYVPSYRLVIEIDGGAHLGREAIDEHRSSELRRLYDVRVVRISASLVECDVEAAVAIVRRACARRNGVVHCVGVTAGVSWRTRWQRKSMCRSRSFARSIRRSTACTSN